MYFHHENQTYDMINVIRQITRQNKWGSLNMITSKKLIRKCNFVVQSSKARTVKSLIDYQTFQTVSTFTFKGIFAKSSFLTFWGHHAISKFKQRFFVTYPIIQASRWRISYVVCITEKSSSLTQNFLISSSLLQNATFDWKY